MKMTTTGFAMCLMLASGPLLAEPPQDKQALKAQILGQLQKRRAQKLKERLALDEKTAKAVFSTMARFEARFQEKAKEAEKVRTQLRQAVMAAGTQSKASDGKLNRLIDALAKLRTENFELKKQRFAEVRKVLTPAQAAKFLVFLPQIEMRLRTELREAMKKAQRRR